MFVSIHDNSDNSKTHYINYSCRKMMGNITYLCRIILNKMGVSVNDVESLSSSTGTIKKNTEVKI